jgi:hypothetical protein
MKRSLEVSTETLEVFPVVHLVRIVQSEDGVRIGVGSVP